MFESFDVHSDSDSSQLSLLETLARRKPAYERQDAEYPLGDNSPEISFEDAVLFAPSQDEAQSPPVGSQDNPIDLDSLSLSAQEEDVPIPLVLAAPVDPLAIPPTPCGDNGFRLVAKNIACTWPQNDSAPETVLARIQALPNVVRAVVSQEDHKDAAGLHLHAYIQFSQQNNRRGCAWLDSLAGKHGDYRVCSPVLPWIRYVIKDGRYVEYNMDSATLTAPRGQGAEPGANKRKSRLEEVALYIRENAETVDYDAVSEKWPGICLMNGQKIRSFIAEEKFKRRKLAKEEYAPPVFSNALTGKSLEIALWLDANIRKPRRFKQKQLYLWSRSPNKGKTTLVRHLESCLSVYHLPKGSNGFIDGYESDKFDLIVCDEFKANYTIQFLNEFLQGSATHLNQKGGGTVKTDNPPVILLSNSPPEELYHKAQTAGTLKPLLARLTVIEIEENDPFINPFCKSRTPDDSSSQS